jgi:hypothetical protein
MSSGLRPTPNLEDHVSVFMCPSDRVTKLYTQATGSLFVAFYGSQGYGGDIVIRLPREKLLRHNFKISLFSSSIKIHYTFLHYFHTIENNCDMDLKFSRP